MGGAIPDEDSDEIIKIMSGWLTTREYNKASTAKQREDDEKGEYELSEEDCQKLDEDLWYPLKDKLDGDAIKTEAHEAVVVEEAVDRIYADATKPLRLIDGGRSLQIVHEQFPDVVVWNPWEDGVKDLKDMPDRDFRRMLCVEAAVASQRIELEAENTWWGRQSLIDE